MITHKKISNQFRSSLTLAIASALGFTSTAHSAAVVWTGNGDATTWQSGANWTGGAVPTSGADVQFKQTTYNSTTSATIDAGGSFTLDSIEFGGTTTGVTTPTLTLNNSVAGGTLTLTSANATAAAATPTAIWVAPKQTNPLTLNTNLLLSPKTGTTSTFYITEITTINGAISGAATLADTGNTTLVLAGANTYSGGTTVAASNTLQLGGSSTVTSGSISSGPVGTGLLTLTTGSTLADNGTALTLANGVSLSGSVHFSGTGSLTINGTGLTTPTGVTLTGNTSFNVTNTTTINSNIDDGGNGYSLSKIGDGAMKLTGVNTYTGTTTVDQNNIQVGADAPSGSPGALGNSTTPVQVGDSSTIHTGSAGLVTTGNFTVGRDISVYNISANPGYVSGVITLGGNTGQTTTSSTFSGTVTLNGPANFQSFTNATHVVDFSGQITGPGALIKTGAGAVQLDNANNNYSGGTTVNDGTLAVSSSGVLGSSIGALSVNNTNTGVGNASLLKLPTGTPTTVGPLSGTIATPSSGINTATIDNGGQLLTINQTTPGSYVGVISGNGGLALGSLSTSTLALGGVNTYAGGTTINAGTLLINGSNTGGGAYAVAGGTLGGTGSIYTGSGQNGLAVAGGASLVPGLLATGVASTAPLSIYGDVTINGSLFIEADAATSELIASGALTLGSNSTLVFTGTPTLTSQAYIIATYGPSELSGTFASITNEPSGYALDYDYGGNNDIALVAASPAPEPAAMGLLGVAVIGLLARRRRNSQAGSKRMSII